MCLLMMMMYLFFYSLTNCRSNTLYRYKIAFATLIQMIWTRSSA